MDEPNEELENWASDCGRSLSPEPLPAVEEVQFVPEGVCRFWIFRNKTGEQHPYFEHYPNSEYVCVTVYRDCVGLSGIKPPFHV